MARPVLLVLVFLASVLLAFSLVSAAGCNQSCANNNECISSSCSRCFANICQAGLPCGSTCTVDTDCYALGSCPLCQNRVCGGSSFASVSPTASRSAYPTPYPIYSQTPTASRSAYPTPYPAFSQSATASLSPYPPAPSQSATASASAYPSQTRSPYPSDSATASPSPYPSQTRSPYPQVSSPSPTPHALYPSSAKICLMMPEVQSWYNSECGPDNMVVVEGNWTAAVCQKYAIAQGYSEYGLGCLNKNAIVIPSKDCWTGFSNVVYKNQTKTCSLFYEAGYCSGIVTTILAGDGWTAAECSSFTRKLFSYTPASAFQGYQLGCNFGEGTGSYSLGSTQGSIPTFDCGWRNPPRIVENVDTRYNSTKFCGWVSNSNSEINVVNVLPSWTASNCHSLGVTRGGNNFFLGCIFFNSFSVGALGGYVPINNCGW